MAQSRYFKSLLLSSTIITCLISIESYASDAKKEQALEESSQAQELTPEENYQIGIVYYQTAKDAKGPNVQNDNYKLAFEYFMRAAQKNHVGAQCKLGSMYYNGYHVKKSTEKAIKYWRKAAKKGEAHAQYCIGLMYYNGNRVVQCYKEAFTWFKKSAEQGHKDAQFNLGLMYKKGEGIEQSFEKAVEWYRAAAEQGSVQAQANLGTMYEEGLGVEQSNEYAILWWKKASDKGDTGAQLLLANMYMIGAGVEQSFEKMTKYLSMAAKKNSPEAQLLLGMSILEKKTLPQPAKKSANYFFQAAEQGNAEAQYSLGVMYDKGQELKQSFEEAIKWYLMAAKQGHIQAQYNLGVLYHFGEGIFQSLEKAAKWYAKSAEQGYSLAQYNLGVMYEKGEGVKKSLKKALEYYQLAAEQGHAQAQLNLGIIYKKYHRDEYSSKTAAQWIQKAAEAGDATAQFSLGQMHQEDTQNFREAVNWIQKAADQNDARALNNLGCMYERGEGIERSSIKAFEFYKRSAELGYALAQSNLGLMYELGRGVEQSYKRALKWYQRAAQQGDIKGQVNLAALYQKSYDTKLNYKEALKWYRKAANQGDLDGLHALGVMHDRGQGIKKSSREAVEWYRKAASAGNVKSLFGLGYKYENGHGVLKDRSIAYQYFKNFITFLDKNNYEKDNLIILYNIAKEKIIYFETEKGERNINRQLLNCLHTLNSNERIKYNKEEDKTALRFLNNSGRKKQIKKIKFYQVSAQKGSKQAQTLLGYFYRYGIGVCQDSIQAIEWLAEAAQRGFFIAQQHLALKLERRFGFEDKVVQQWIYRSIRESNDQNVQASDQKRDKLIAQWKKGDFQAAAELGKLYADLSIVRAPQTTDADVFEWLSKAVELDGDLKAQYRLGRMYQYGWGTKVVDTNAAFECFQQGAQKGHIPSYKALGEFYLSNSAPGSLEEALNWYRKAAQQDDKGATAMLREISGKRESPGATYLLARAHDEGWGIAKDKKEAFALFKRAAKAGNVRAQYELVVKYLQNSDLLEGDLDPVELLTRLAGQEAVKNYMSLTNQRLGRKTRKNLCKLPKKGYYRAQHKLAELYAVGKVFPLNSVKEQKNSYQEAIRLYEESTKAIFQGKNLSLTPLDQVREELKKLNSISGKETFNLDHPGFQDFLDREGVAQKFDQEFIEVLAPVFDAVQKHPQKDKLEPLLEQMVAFPAQGKSKWAVLTKIKELLASKKMREDIDFSLLSNHIKQLSPLWSELVDPESTHSSNLKINEKMLRDPRIDLFNTCFRGFEGEYYKDTFENAVQKIQMIFKKLHEPSFLGEAHKDEKGLIENTQKLEYFLTQKKAPTNRFAHRLVRVSDILQRKFERAHRKRDMDALTALRLMLSHWAARGVGDCRTGAEDELNKFYLESLLSYQGNDSEALTQEDWTLEMQIAVSLSNLRLKIIDGLVLEKDEDRIHAVKHLEKKLRGPLALLGDAENYEDTFEKISVASKYLKMTPQEIQELVLKRYTPDLMAEHLAKSLKNPQKSDVKGKAISSLTHEKLYRRLQFQFIRSQIAPDGDLDKTFFQDEEHLLNHTTQKEFEQHTRHKEKLSKHPIEWNVLKKQAFDQASNIRQKFYDESFFFTKEGAKALLYSLGYLEVPEGATRPTQIQFRAFSSESLSESLMPLPKLENTQQVNSLQLMSSRASSMDFDYSFEIEERKLQGVLHQTQLTFKEHPVIGDGACGFHALGIDRARAVKQLLSHQRETNFRNLLMPEIRSMFMAGTLKWSPLSRPKILKIKHHFFPFLRPILGHKPWTALSSPRTDEDGDCCNSQNTLSPPPQLLKPR